ncbi:MAG: phage holin family protein [Bacilli bacterium]|nr:phage holin family protein [Bacilli bacterium]MDD4733235.1 phage holin family protein [Bacilli bacterium]
MKKIVIINDKKTEMKEKTNIIISYIATVIGYALVLILTSVLFPKTFYIDNSMFGIWAIIATMVIFLLNKTVKPVLIWLTLPITGITLGLFYPFINVIILNMVDFILGSHFEIQGLFMSFLVAMVISILNIFMEILVLRPITKKGR